MTITVVRTELTGYQRDVSELLNAYHTAANERGEEWFDIEDFGLDVDEAVAADLERLESAALPEPLFLALDVDEAVGTVQLKELHERTVEVKRLYVVPSYRGEGTGRRLVERVIEETAEVGYETLRLGVAPYHESARALYQDLGFEFTQPYGETNCPEWLHDDWNFMKYSHTE